jgi:hypothetical protein
MELPVRMNMPQRLASLTRFREKRKERCYDKKIRYTVRKEVAQRCSLFLLCIVNLQIVESRLLSTTCYCLVMPWKFAR